MLTPAYSRQRVTFFALAAVESAWLDGDEIAGKFAQELKQYYGSEANPLFEDFVNWPNTPHEILRFTQLYGPLIDSAEPAGEFRFKLTDWRMWQDGFRHAWQKGTSLLGF